MAVGQFLPFEQTYDDGTLIANEEVGGMTEDEAAELLHSKINQWRTEANVNYVLLEQRKAMPNEAILFDVRAALEEAWTQRSVDLLATVDEQIMRDELMTIGHYETGDRIDFSLLTRQLTEDVRSMKRSNKTYQLQEFFLPDFQLREEVVSEVTLDVSGAYLAEWAQSLNGYIIEPQALFSMQEALDQSGVTVLDSEALDVFATGLFQLFTKTNFNLLERHVNLTLPAYATVGYAAAASPNSMDLKVLNPNHHSYELSLSYVNNQLRISLMGLSFIHDYSLVVENIEEIEPRTIVHISPRRTIGDKQVMSEGALGFSADVYQVVSSSEGTMIERNRIASDYYPAMHRIEELSLQEAQEEEQEDNPFEGILPVPVPPSENNADNSNDRHVNSGSESGTNSNTSSDSTNSTEGENQGSANTPVQDEDGDYSSHDNNQVKQEHVIVKGEE
ncbi:hypothetical protein IQ10_01795 [Halalkalibacter nanhaiisediminis]|uniref:VanW like protein n=2 Tax=Halalkalibacter nanhaiisediminis TaxID=688079 RepID=A0A562QK13_9BACI|nr:hypothetical protein IQ10_01795 [Halalkalibacter nanhaiisediminis]